jgi:hypothetical protein
MLIYLGQIAKSKNINIFLILKEFQTFNNLLLILEPNYLKKLLSYEVKKIYTWLVRVLGFKYMEGKLVTGSKGDECHWI